MPTNAKQNKLFYDDFYLCQLYKIIWDLGLQLDLENYQGDDLKEFNYIIFQKATII